ncbi:protein DOWNY MILDEW RESISTANCE 6-like [Senna tora]|uniref:Protein DOWNY MILDEW RESISTANCE 6-like n=1 Tax=Senna tora TaxID=362788 RepID=A0A834TA87_9FABA|nr:protein DOWNY MILDEW RESISTANCE 6-like [Senna tora]
MEKLVSKWFNLRPVPQDYIYPPEERPGNNVPIGEGIPVIDLSEAEQGDRTLTIHKILKAAQDFGFFQVINHGVSENLMDETMSVLKDFFQLPDEDKQKFFTDDFSKSCVYYTSSINYAIEKIHLWRDFLKHPCHPLDKWQHVWPENPPKYRECVGACSVQVKKLASRILELIGEGLGLESGYLNDELSAHDVYGLQVLNKDDVWIGVEPIPHAFVVNIGSILQVISNNKLRSSEHRVVTNSSDARTSAAFFLSALEESMIEPAKALIDELHPALYKPFINKDFVTHFLASNNYYSEEITKPFKA